MKLYRHFRFIAVPLTVTLASLTMVAGPVSSAEAAPNSYLVAAARASEPVGSVGETFFTSDVYINTQDANVSLAGSPNGRSDFWVDDILKIDVTRPDGTVTSVSFDDSNGCTATTVLTTAPVSLERYLQAGLNEQGMNKLHFTFSDACGGNDGNSPIYLVGDFGLSATLPSLPSMDGGTFVHVHHKPGEGTTICTSGFSISTAETKYMLLAKHCFDGGNPQNTNQYIPGAMPVTITTIDSPRGQNDKHSFATELSCLAGTIACLLPMDNAAPSGDMVAFRPDTATPTDMVRTRAGLLPVLGETTLGALPSGQVICHYGAGSAAEFGSAEQCGTSLGTSAGLGQIKAKGFEGDSGGPVYVYSRDAAGNINGVYALGITIAAGQVCGVFGLNCHPVTQFIPIRSIEADLGARLIEAP